MLTNLCHRHHHQQVDPSGSFVVIQSAIGENVHEGESKIDAGLTPTEMEVCANECYHK